MPPLLSVLTKSRMKCRHPATAAYESGGVRRPSRRCLRNCGWCLVAPRSCLRKCGRGLVAFRSCLRKCGWCSTARCCCLQNRGRRGALITICRGMSYSACEPGEKDERLANQPHFSKRIPGYLAQRPKFPKRISGPVILNCDFVSAVIPYDHLDRPFVSISPTPLLIRRDSLSVPRICSATPPRRVATPPRPRAATPHRAPPRRACRRASAARIRPRFRPSPSLS